jgi:hypothetical protein
MPTSWRFPVVVGTARQPAGRLPLPTNAGEVPGDVFAGSALDSLLDEQPPAAGLATARSRTFLQWRYGNAELGYRVVLTKSGRAEDGFAVFRRRRRGQAVEGVLCEVIAPGADPRTGRDLARRVAAAADADYLLRIDARVLTAEPFVRLPRTGPILACRPLDASPPPSLSDFSLTMGDVELF